MKSLFFAHQPVGTIPQSIDSSKVDTIMPSLFLYRFARLIFVFTSLSLNLQSQGFTLTTTKFTTSSQVHRNAHQHYSQPTESIEVNSHADWLELLHGHEDDRLTVILFKAAFCKSCKRLELDWKHKVLPKAGPALTLATMEFTTNRALFKQLKIQDLPTIQFYFRGSCLTSYTCPPKEFPRVMNTLDHYLKASHKELEFEADMESKRLSLPTESQSKTKEKLTA